MTTIQVLKNELLYAPSRDIGYMTVTFFQFVAQRLEEEADPFIHKVLMRDYGVTAQDLCDVCDAHAKFFAAAEDETPVLDAVQASGLHNTKPAARIVFFYYGGLMLNGMMYEGIQDTCRSKEEMESRIDAITTSLYRSGVLFEVGMSRSPWKRWWYRLGRAIRRVVFRGWGIPTIHRLKDVRRGAK